MPGRMPSGPPLAGPAAGAYGAGRPVWLDPAVMLQTLVVVYFVFLLWMEYDSWQREEAEALSAGDRDDF